MTDRVSTVDLLKALISFDTTSHKGNLAFISWVENFLDRWGVTHYRIDYEPGFKTNLFATIGPDEAGGIVLSGHSDVVPVTGQSWASDPFTLDLRGDKFYGRGTCDMKGFIAACLGAVPDMVAAGLKRPIHFAISCDEEVGCKGVRPLIDHLAQLPQRPGMVIVGEPTEMQVVNAHKSAVTFSTEVLGHEAHSSLIDQGVNAIMVAGDLLGELNRIRADLIARGDPSHRFSPAYSTLHVGVIEGGTAKNIIPRRCAFAWETRLLPEADAHEVPLRFESFSQTMEATMHRVNAETGITTCCTNSVPGLRPEALSPAEDLALYLTGENDTQAVSYCTEAGLFQQIGIPAVICGPGSISQAHKPDEFISASELQKADIFIQNLIKSCRITESNHKEADNF